jgi:NTE family protein
LSDFATFAKSLIRLTEGNGASKEVLQRVFEDCISCHWQALEDDSLKSNLDVDFVVRLERKNNSHTISNKTFDFSKTTIRLLIQDGYKDTKEQMKEVAVRIKKELS